MKVRFAVGANGQSKQLFSIRQVKNSGDKSVTDLNLHFRGGGRSRFATTFDELVKPADPSKYVSAEQHLSIHANPGRDTNTITRRLVLEEGNAEAGKVLVTTGIKAGLFVPILFKVCGDLSGDRHELPKTTDKVLSFGDFNPERDQLRFMVILSAGGNRFPTDEEHPTNSMSVSFQDYEVTVLWSYFNFAAPPHALNVAPFSTEETGVVPGYQWQEVYNLYTDLNMAYAEAYFRLMDDGTGISVANH
ncbi:hypothetical protein [Rhizobium sp. AG207R]|uniref:hypothetical protein n=1 Tax=Rhizobium sp. AG207R TaxID=2802287 RepID=UPI0022ABD586|nr:hypothetical protein [Rhizobium sp. AG207R]MCZ3380400.1 hypothetical protein [Rhizobium sp. AG207R]